MGTACAGIFGMKRKRPRQPKSIHKRENEPSLDRGQFWAWMLIGLITALLEALVLVY